MTPHVSHVLGRLPEGRQCSLRPQEVPFVNDADSGRIIAQVDAAAAPPGRTRAEAVPGITDPAGAPSDGSVYLLMSSAAATASSGTAGNFEATDLKPSGTWQTGLSSGSFTYSYPLPEPPSPSGSGPGLSLAYDSSTVDGMTRISNSQSGWVGLGWDVAGLGFIERRYRACSTDVLPKQAKHPYQEDSGHQCWESPDENDGDDATSDPTNSELVLSLDGRSSRLLKDRETGQWKTENDFGWRIRLIGDDGSGGSGSSWEITTQEGDVHTFGSSRSRAGRSPSSATTRVNPATAPTPHRPPAAGRSTLRGTTPPTSPSRSRPARACGAGTSTGRSTPRGTSPSTPGPARPTSTSRSTRPAGTGAPTSRATSRWSTTGAAT
ncbi:hypothetical protein ACFOWE_15205 [Planomonospora corallina]|uniref:Uncharacterized protein n=1 Tax=Planomonospora corallina TaxID=1806052 RepID=A0ABV8I8X8_9ACTN